MGMCVVENLSRVFLFEWPPLLLCVMRVYIVWVKGKKVTLKNPPGREFHGYFARRPYSRDTPKMLQAGMTLQLPTCASHVALLQVASSKTLVKSIDSSFYARFFTNLILSPIQ